MKRIFCVLIFTSLIASLAYAQEKKKLDHDAIESWKRITETEISADGEWIAYTIEPWKGDSEVYLYNNRASEAGHFCNAKDIQFSYDSKILVFKKTLPLEEKRKLQMEKTAKKDMPGDKLCIYEPGESSLREVEDIRTYKMPAKWGGYIAYQAALKKIEDEDAAAKEDDKSREESAENGFTLVLLNTNDGSVLNWPYVKEYLFASEQPVLLFESAGDEDNFEAGLYRYDITAGQLSLLHSGNGKYRQHLITDNGNNVAFLYADKDDYSLFTWDINSDKAIKAGLEGNGMPGGWVLSPHRKLSYNTSAERLFFGIAPAVPEKDSLRLEDEYPDVDIWHGTEGKLHTVQVINKDRDLKKSYLASYDLKAGRMIALGNSLVPEIRLINKGDSRYALGLSNVPYELQSMWEGSPRHYDAYLVDLQNGQKKMIKEDIRAWFDISPAGKYIVWYNYTDSSFYSYNLARQEENRLTEPSVLQVANEMNDVPNLPGPYAPTGWLENDESLLVNDRYDIWKLDPNATYAPQCLTINGRKTQTSYRYVSLDDDEEFIISGSTILLKGHNELSRESFYFACNTDKPGVPRLLTGGEYSLNNPVKAREGKTVVYAKASFELFPDLLLTDMKFKKSVKISNANPQQSDYLWGSAELVKWTSLDGRELEGLLYKPENFDPSKKYPMIVNFYEKDSQGLYDARIPELHRSTIDYHYYTSNGYLVFNPDVYYRDGYPGESAYNCVMPGITSLIEKGFVDASHIGAQGHSWGGYQVAYLATRTGLFAAIESGAPVVNMFSAYGGIRWWTGLNRSFQYEHTQSRIGATIWEAPLRYLENSPLFTMDKVTTPILIMHNDSDGHVPWYQGIEYFIALRRLQKPVWMLNYSGEPHWPQKLKNKKDFQIRLSQFFDHYLKDKPMPEWMMRGIPATEKDYNLGYELVK